MPGCVDLTIQDNAKFFVVIKTSCHKRRPCGNSGKSKYGGSYNQSSVAIANNFQRVFAFTCNGVEIFLPVSMALIIQQGLFVFRVFITNTAFFLTLVFIIIYSVDRIINIVGVKTTLYSELVDLRISVRISVARMCITIVSRTF